MKRSEFYAQRERFWAIPRSNVPLAEKDCLAAEAAGVEWDPEEEPLPERLAVAEDGGRSFIRPEPPDLWRGEWQKSRSLKQAVYRHNAWVRLRETATACNYPQNGEDCLRQALRDMLDILDGREQP